MKSARTLKKTDPMNYWAQTEENLILEYRHAGHQRKNEIAKHFIPKFKYMIDGLVARNCWRKINQYDKDDTLSWIFTIIDKFDPNKGNKAFSYFTRCVRNKLFKINKTKHMIQWHGVTNTSNHRATLQLAEYWKQAHTDSILLVEEMEAINFIVIMTIKDIEKYNNNKANKISKALLEHIFNIKPFPALNKKAIYYGIRDNSNLTTKQLYETKRKYFVSSYQKILKDNFQIKNFSVQLNW